MNLFEEYTPRPNPSERPTSIPSLPDRIEYHIFDWSQRGAHRAELRTKEPLAIPAIVEGDTFNEFIDHLYWTEREFGFLTILSWS